MQNQLTKLLRAKLGYGMTDEEMAAAAGLTNPDMQAVYDQTPVVPPEVVPTVPGSVEQPSVGPREENIPAGGVGISTLNEYRKPSDQVALEKEIERKTQENLEAQRAAIAESQAAYNNLQAKPEEVDLSGGHALYNLLTRTGDRLGKDYKAPQTAEQRRAELEKLRQGIIKQRAGLSDDDINFLKAELARKTQNANDARQARFEEGQDAKLFNDVQKQATNLTKDAADFKQITANLDKAYSPDAEGKIPYARVRQSLSSFARLMGEKGVLTDTDVARQWREPIDAIVAKYKTLNDPNAKIDANDVKVLVAAMNDAKESFADSYKMKADNFVSQFQDPYSPLYEGKRKWAKKMAEKIYAPVSQFRSSSSLAAPAKQQVDHSSGAMAELKKRGLIK